MARTKPTPPSATVVLLVRHGQTPTTGKLLPGRAPGLHLADVGHEQAQRAADRIAALKTVDAPSLDMRMQPCDAAEPSDFTNGVSWMPSPPPRSIQ